MLHKVTRQGPGICAAGRTAIAGLTMLGCKAYGGLNDSALKVAPVDELLRGVEDKVALHEHSRARRPQARQHILCNRRHSCHTLLLRQIATWLTTVRGTIVPD